MVKNMNLTKKLIDSKKYIIFDLDGTLIESTGIWNEADYKLIYKFANIKVDTNVIMADRKEFLKNNVDKDTYVAYCKFLINKYDFKEKDEKIILKERRKFANDILAYDIDFKEGSIEFIKLLKKTNHILILATLNTKEQMQIYTKINKKMTNKINIEEEFDFIMTKEDTKNKKPDPEIYLNVLNKYKEERNKFLILEDSLSGVIAAKEANIDVVNVYDKYSDNDREEINKFSTYTIKSYNEILKLFDN